MPERFVTIILPVPAGLHVLRYQSAADLKRPPRVLVMGQPGASEGVALLFSPGARDGVLARFDECVAIAAERASALMITTMADPLSVSSDVELKLEPLDRPHARPAAVRERTSTPPVRSGSARFQVTGQMRGIGATTTDPNGWLGGPSSTAALESFAVGWVDAIKGVRLAYGCDVKGRGRQVARVPGQSVGIPDLPITRVLFELSGSESAGHVFEVEAAFLGASDIMRASGRKIELAGPTGDEPLVGLNVAIREAPARPVEPAAQAAVAAPAPRAPETPQARLAERTGAKVRVFRAPALAN